MREDLQRSEALGHILLATESTSSTGAFEELSSEGEAGAAYADLFEGDGATNPGDTTDGSGTEEPDRPLGFLAYLTKLIPQNLFAAVSAPGGEGGQ